MKNYTVRLRCKSHLENDETVNESNYEMLIEAENLEEVFFHMDELLENWDSGASISLNAPGGKINVETLEIISPEGEVLY